MRLNEIKRQVTEQTASKLRDLHPDVPADKWLSIVGRSIVGAVLSLLGFGLLGGSAAIAGWMLVHDRTPTVLTFTALGTAFGAGLFLMVLGLVTAAGRILRQPLQLVSATFEAVWGAIWRRGRAGP